MLIKLILAYFSLTSDKKFELIKFILVNFRLSIYKKLVSAKLLVI